MRSLNFNDGFSSASAPSQGAIQQNAYAIFANDAAFVTAKGSAAANGDVYYNSTTERVREFVDSAWRNAVQDDLTQTLSNKTLTSPTINGGTIGSSANIDANDNNITNIELQVEVFL